MLYHIYNMVYHKEKKVPCLGLSKKLEKTEVLINSLQVDNLTGLFKHPSKTVICLK